MDTNRGFAYNEHEASAYDRATIAAIFDTPDQAKAALKDLHEAKFHKTWMGITSTNVSTGTPSGTYDRATGTFTPDSATSATDGEHVVETAAGGGIGETLSRFFGENNQQSLHDALIKQGVPASDAMALDHRMHDGGAVITVQVDDRYDEAVRILQQERGEIASSGSANTARVAAPVAAPTYGTAVAATDVEDEKTIALREERLAIDKQRVAAGEATIEKKVVAQSTSVDVPIMHEELFIERRPVTDAAPSGAIGTDQTIRVPLMREQVVVDKRTFVTEEVAIGKRAVSETQRVDETVRHEELVVDKETATRPQL